MGSRSTEKQASFFRVQPLLDEMKIHTLSFFYSPPLASSSEGSHP